MEEEPPADSQMLPPDEDHGYPTGYEDLPAEASPQSSLGPSSSSAAPPPPPLPPSSSWSTMEGTWWNRVGSIINTTDLKVGGATFHHSHWLTWLGNAEHRIVFCPRCAGTTSGAFSPLLAQPCNRQAADTSRRAVRRMLVDHVWPTPALRAQFGRAFCSPTIGFQQLPDTDELRIATAGPGVRSIQV